MSKYIATRALRGAQAVVKEAEDALNAAMQNPGPDTKIELPMTAYYLPTIYGMLGHKVEKISDLQWVVDYCKSIVSPIPGKDLWTPYLGETLDAGMATLFAEEVIEGIAYAKGERPESKNGYTYNGAIDDVQMRTWGVA
ncbi:MAG: CO dehydrogenase/CO-methylating acetyl-CoA synthase complex subunit beta, partial [Chloroflexi bacterium]|nr:CO dehydrogenase/CO-methylating acetyl-CoA synthase complex subunit beta [Chloroflexota bacterium]